MNNLQKFNNTIEDFDKELIKLKGASEAYQKLQALVTSYAKTNEQFIKNGKSLEELATQQQQKQGELAQSLWALQDANKAGKDEIKKQNEVFEKNTLLLLQQFRKDINEYLIKNNNLFEEHKAGKEAILKQNEIFEKSILLLFQQFRKEINESFNKNGEAFSGFTTLQHGSLTKGLNAIREETMLVRGELQKQTEDFRKEQSFLLDRIRKENVNFYTEFDKVMRTNLQQQKVEVKQIFDAERNVLKETLEVELSKRTQEIMAQQKRIELLLYLLGFIITVIAGFVSYTFNK